MNNKKKIGIITYYNFYNYGSVLQAYALSKFINSLSDDYEAILIEYDKNNKLRNKVISDRILFMFCHPSTIVPFLQLRKNASNAVNDNNSSVISKFNSFISENFILDREYFYKDTDSYYAFIAGSDQVWQLNAPGLHYTFFLRFALKKQRISYAASFGTVTIPKSHVNRLRKYLLGFKNISVREKDGLDIIRKVFPKGDGPETVQVLDPVLLVGSDFWKNVLTKRDEIQGKYILCYFLGDPSAYINSINEFAGQKGLKIIWIATGFEMSQGTIKYPDPFEFVNLFSNASYVCTDSLHGTEFSILFHKQFTCFPRVYTTGKEQVSRIRSLTDLLSLTSRYSSEIVTEENIDYFFVDRIISQEQRRSTQYLIDSLSI